MKSIKELFKTALELMNQHTDFVFATVIASSGSVPRGAGSRMLVTPDGTAYGTVGGGNVEYHSIQQAKKLFAEKCSCKKEYILRADEAADLGMVCGGDAVIYFQYVSWEDSAFRAICSEISASFHNPEDSWLILDITDTAKWSAGFYRHSKGLTGLTLNDTAPLLAASAALVSLNGRQYYSEPLIHGGIVYIFGGGHVAQELVPLLTHLDFHCVIYDDREMFSSKELFPAAAGHITADFSDISRQITITDQDYVCIMSRGHQFDYIIQKQILRTPARYIGVIGSRRKKAAIHKKLQDDGYTPEDLARIITPIGLDIQAETPAEIAVSIAGQLIQHRASVQGA
ncbi:MAG: XdhC family protein [Clostridiales bacterium]|nr:XdhC family protein [Clostridiales bacterium]